MNSLQTLISLIATAIKKNNIDKMYGNLLTEAHRLGLSSYTLNVLILKTKNLIENKNVKGELPINHQFIYRRTSINLRHEKCIVNEKIIYKERSLEYYVLFAICIIMSLTCIMLVVNMNKKHDTLSPNDPVVIEEKYKIESPKDSSAFYTDNNLFSQERYVENYNYKNSKGLVFQYTGTAYSQKIPHGSGSGIYENGIYSGDYLNGLRHGTGTFTTNDSANHYSGSFAEDLYLEGTLTLSDGKYYIGTFKNGKPEKGVWYNKDKSVFTTIDTNKKSI